MHGSETPVTVARGPGFLLMRVLGRPCRSCHLPEGSCPPRLTRVRKFFLSQRFALIAINVKNVSVPAFSCYSFRCEYFCSGCKELGRFYWKTFNSCWNVRVTLWCKAGVIHHWSCWGRGWMCLEAHSDKLLRAERRWGPKAPRWSVLWASSWPVVTKFC